MSKPDEPSRQAFLGPEAERACRVCHVGIVGLGGGGSHVAQQLAHIGFEKFELFDYDVVEASNLNRLVGGTAEDVLRKTPKVAVASRLIRSIRPRAVVQAHQERWQDSAGAIHSCDVIFGCLDGFGERQQLEAITRRYLIPYFDIGLDVHTANGKPPQMAGQVLLSMPGGPCMRCLGLLSDELLALEASHYGDAGPRPQVVWANGVLASTAVGLLLGVLTKWHGRNTECCYYSYSANEGTVTPHVRWEFRRDERCTHYPPANVGSPVFRKL